MNRYRLKESMENLSILIIHKKYLDIGLKFWEGFATGLISIGISVCNDLGSWIARYVSFIEKYSTISNAVPSLFFVFYGSCEVSCDQKSKQNFTNTIHKFLLCLDFKVSNSMQ